MEYKEYLNQIIRFNGDKDLLMMREKYNDPSFFEIISKERSETTFSSFLKWLFSINVSLDSASPVMMLLDILVRRSNMQQENTVLIPENLILTQQILTNVRPILTNGWKMFGPGRGLYKIS